MLVPANGGPWRRGHIRDCVLPYRWPHSRTGRRSGWVLAGHRLQDSRLLVFANVGKRTGGAATVDGGSLLDDPDQFSAFYEHHAEAVLIWLTRRVFDPEVAVDLTAEVFAQAYASRGMFRGSTPAEAGGWVFAIARHVLWHFLRKGEAERRAIARLGIQSPLVGEDEHQVIVERAGLLELRALVREQLQELSREQLAALQLRVVDELPYPEVAGRLGISEQNARARVSRGLRALATALDHADPGRVVL